MVFRRFGSAWAWGSEFSALTHIFLLGAPDTYEEKSCLNEGKRRGHWQPSQEEEGIGHGGLVGSEKALLLMP